jgi:signal transduction histidine kinase
MDLFEADSLVPLIAAGGYILLLIGVFLRRAQQERLTRWLLGFLLLSIIWEFLVLTVPDTRRLPNLSIKTVLLSTTLLGLITAEYANWPKLRYWLPMGGMVVLITLLVDIFLPTQSFALAGLGLTKIRYSNLLSHLIWFTLSGYILFRTWRDYRRTVFPWHANRLLFWLIALLFIFAGEALLFLRWTGFTLTGQITRIFGVMGLAYAVSSHRIFDVRTRSQSVLAFIAITLIASSPLSGSVLLVQWLARDEREATVIVLSVITISIGLLIYGPFRKLVERIVHRYLPGQGVDTSKVVRSYSRAAYRTLDVSQLSLVIIGTLGELLDAQKGALMLTTETDKGLELEPLPVMGHIPRQGIRIPRDSQLITSLVEQHQPLLQYEIDFNPDYANISPEVKSWLKALAMDVYIPIGTGTEIAGLIAIGPRSSGVPYQPDELEMAQMLADQTVVALQNSRLYSELAKQNEKVRDLNVDLVNQNERLEIMDRVKSDFITIASHELRTPLTQVKGYADILASMNEEESLTREQTRGIVSHINRATLNLESVITAMLDASQIDVAGIQLAVKKTTMESVVRTAIEPLSQAIRERRISVNLEGFDDLPPTIGDFKRLVQAFSNLIGNAVKYTPDHGTIALIATSPPAEGNQQEFVEMIIADTGIGIDPKFHDLIFEKFFRVGDPQLHSTGITKFKGAGPGLGLPIAKGVIEAHGGRLWVESEGEDERRLPGSRFHIVLPVQPPRASIEHEIESEPQSAYLPK